MPKYPYRQVGVVFNRVRNDLNNNLIDIESDIKETNTSIQTLKTQVNRMIVRGDSSPAADQAREDANGFIYDSLKERIDAEQLKIGEYSTLPDWLQESLYEVVTKHDEYLRQVGVNVKQPPFNAKLDLVTDETELMRSAIKYAEDNNLNLIIPGIAIITGEMEFKKPNLIVSGIGSGSGYTSAGIAGYTQKSGFLVKGTGAKRIRTRVKHRASALDPQDDPLSVALNVQAENVVFRNFSVFLNFDRTNNSPTNYGDNWDIGIFVGCRTHFFSENVHVVGYFREAGFHFDVTHATNLPRFKDLAGNPYDNTANVSGGDGCNLAKCMTWGAKWGIKVQGAKPATGQTTYGPQYYDEALGALVEDYRGTFGFSDFTTYSGRFYGTDHHSEYRRNAASGNYLTDTAGGSMSVDGMAGNASGAIQGHRHYSTRFATFEPYTVKLDRANRIQFFGCHMEMRSSTSRKNPNGTTVQFTDADKYGLISCTPNTNNVLLIGHTGALNYAFIPSTVQIHNILSSSSSSLSETTDILKAQYFRSSNGQFVSDSGEFDGRSASESDAVRFRRGTITTFIANAIETILYNIVKPNQDNANSIGDAARRFTQLFAATGTINTSDRNSKTEIGTIPDAVLDAWSEVNYSQFKFIDAVQEKGENARFHVGVIAQEIEEAFIRHGLNAFTYGLLCYDEWEDQYDDIDGQQMLVVPAGSRYSIRPDECLMLECALSRRELNRLRA